MKEVVTAPKRLLATEVDLGDHYVLTMKTPVLIEAGQRYWVDRTASALVVEDGEGNRQAFSGVLEPCCRRG